MVFVRMQIGVKENKQGVCQVREVREKSGILYVLKKSGKSQGIGTKVGEVFLRAANSTKVPKIQWILRG